MTQWSTEWAWPEGNRAAVSLTYDDGHPDNLDHAIPDLEENGLRGTFYLTTGRERVHDRVGDWKKAFQRGHEIGNHTVRHPARADAYAPNIPHWLPPEIQLEGYSVEDISREVDEAAVWLDVNIGVDPYRTFAYPCCSVAIGEEPDEAPYDAAVMKHHFAARVGGSIPNNPISVELHRIQSFGFREPSVDQLIEHCQDALRTGGWTVLMFHSVEGPSHNTSHQVHQALLDYLTKESYWVAPLRETARYVREGRKR